MQSPLKNWEKIKRGYKFGEKTFYSSFHLGVDYIMPQGSPIYAPAGCEIVKSGNFPEGGNTVYVKIRNRKHGLLVMRFMHLSKMSPLGKYKAGEILGYTGNTGKLTKGPHLHLDISRTETDLKKTSNFIDPEKFFKIVTRPAA